MFTGLAKFRFVQSWRIAPGPCEAMFSKGMFSRDMHSNDNLLGFSRPGAERRIPSPALACHWFNRNGRLECRWQAETIDDAPLGGVDEHELRNGQPSMQPRGRALTLAG